MSKGLDVSMFNSVDLGAAKRDGYEFVIVRTGYGGGGKDTKFSSYWGAAKAVGLVRGAYHFAYPGRSSGAQQAQEFLAIVGQLQPGDFLALDMEDEPAYGRHLVASDVAWAKEFLDTCKKISGIKPLLYMNTDLKGRFDWSSVQKGDYGLWHANYTGKEPAASPWAFNAIWQYTSSGTAGGAHPVDVDTFNGPVANLVKYGAGGAVSLPVPSAPAPTQPAAPTANGHYTVRGGDTLSAIAARYRTTWQALASLNRLPNPDRIYPGQVLIVPGEAAAYRTYTVAKGDNLSTIAARLGTTVTRLVQLNGIANPNLIYPGQVLKY